MKLRLRGLPVPGEDGKNAAKKTGPAKASGSAKQTKKGNQASSVSAQCLVVKDDCVDLQILTRVFFSPQGALILAKGSKTADKGNNISSQLNEFSFVDLSLPHIEAPKPVALLCHPYPVLVLPVRGRKPSNKKAAEPKTPINMLDLIKCNHYPPTERGVTVHVESGVMACVEYREYSEMNVYATHEFPHSPCVDDMIIIICKTSVTFARIPGHLNAHHALVNCRRVTGALTPWLDYSEPITVYVLCPRTPNGQLWYMTEDKTDRLNAVYAHMQDFAMPIGSFLFESYWPTLSETTDIDCSITVGPVIGGDIDLTCVESPSIGNIGNSVGQDSDFGFGFGQTDAPGYGFGQDLNNVGSSRSPTNDNTLENANVWTDLGKTQKHITLAPGSGIYQTYHDDSSGSMHHGNEMQPQVQTQTHGGMSAFDQYYAEELGFINPPSFRPQVPQQQQPPQNDNPFAQNTGGYQSTNNNNRRRTSNKTIFDQDPDTIGVGFDCQPYVTRRPRLIVRDMIGERIL
ncbi:hypothetical protein PISL3812_06998 [Talaromyces islandicus]|uniref:Uncharacterized protein n=1 Tax=Talaromyces islandicus TaxID=28573 RepID=A0A0U1M2Z3_TALIS|nr:hypothetical protein PISL3812_06998 [Talaromyces islandicus]